MYKKVVWLIYLIVLSSTVYAQKGTISGVVSDEFSVLPGAKIEVLGAEKYAICNVNGYFSFELTPGKYTIKASYLLYGAIQKEVIIEFNTLDVIVNFELKPGNSADAFFSVGSRSQSRSLLETAVSVDIITAEELAQTNQASLSQALQFLIPSFHSVPQTISDGTDHIEPSSLRGLGPDQILVLINGKRKQVSPLLNVNGTIGRGTVGTDFNTIPVGAIDRIEVLKDGAAAQYGSDAIAGVINIILKEEAGVFTANTSVQPTIEGDGTETAVSANYGVGLKDKGFVNVTTEYRNRNSWNRAGDYTGNVYSLNNVTDKQLINQNNFFGKLPQSGNRVMEIGGATIQDASIFMNANFPLQSNASLYMNGGSNYRTGQAKGFYRFPYEEEKVVLEFYENGFLPEIHTNIIDNALTMGVKGNRNGWLIDFSNSRFSNSLDFSVENSNNASLGIASPRSFDDGGFKYNQNISNVDFSKTLDSIWFFQSLNIAFGSVHRQENYQIHAGDEESYTIGTDTTSTGVSKVAGSQVFPGFEPANALNKTRNNTAFYLDLEAQVSPKLMVSGALRDEYFSDFGSSIIWHLASRFKFSEKVSARASYNTGFRAPSLHQVYFNSISTQFEGGVSEQVGTFNNESAVGKAFGIEQLKPETSTNVALGVTAKLSKDVHLSIDIYDIDIDDRIVLSGKFDTGFAHILKPVGVGAAQFFANAVSTSTNGIDISFRYGKKINNGRFTLKAAYNFSKTEVNPVIKVPSSLIGFESTLFNREEVSRLEVAQPNSKAIVSMQYKMGKWQFLLKNTRFSSLQYIHPDDGDKANWQLNEFTGKVESRDQKFSAKVLTDLAIIYKINNYLSWSIGGNNILNVYPDKHEHSANTVNGNFVYSRRVQQFGVRGANYFTKVLFTL